MEINDKLVSYVAELAHLKIDEAQREQAAADLARMIGYVDQLSELDTTGVEPRFSDRQCVPRGRSQAEHGTRTDPEERAGCQRRMLPCTENGGIRREKRWSCLT